MDVPAALEAIKAMDYPVAAKAAFHFMVLTACRSAEAMGATRDEVDGNIWKIPGIRMKTGREHRIPLPLTALAVLETMCPLRTVPVWSFPASAPIPRCPMRHFAGCCQEETFRGGGISLFDFVTSVTETLGLF